MTNKGCFRKGHDPRHHQFTRDECVAGFWAAFESVITRYPDAVQSDGRHMVVNMLPALIVRKPV
jgi:hypothetical protein